MVKITKKFPISRDPPEGGTLPITAHDGGYLKVQFPISRDPPEGGTIKNTQEKSWVLRVSNF